MGQRVSGPVLVGCDAEVARLRTAIERVAGRQLATVLIAGEAGPLEPEGWAVSATLGVPR